MTLRVGVVGAGGISPTHGGGWQALGAEIGVYSLEHAPRFAERHGATEYASLEELLGNVDIVDVITPTPAHVEIAKAALAAGKDVVCEKPMARNLADARELVALAEQHGRKLYPAHVVRWFPQYAAAKAAVEAGELGQLAVMRFNRAGQMPRTPWFFDDEASGGIIMDQMLHDLDQAVWIGGPVATVYATETRGEPGAEGGLGDTRVGLVTMTHRNGAISLCRGIWGAPGLPFWYSFQVAGTTGLLRYDSRHETGFQLTRASSAAEDDGSYLPSVTSFDPYAAEIADFAAAFAGGPEPRVTMHDGVEAVKIAEAALESLRTGRTVTVEEN
ncbi:Gfo/Idh/MocA family protein [Aestuariimicrobium ganziense]|uniref:Gfo/Idh/MocA family protein n=1 Tax=Aestuariimicrobium ganziense TaxID=2773677 RepID=UPI0019449DF6|nr:Gfo/Idh/MocA family oxidoreductase [Aestuariimicrobium ganziense]